jgi:hypothetical protein
MHFINFRYSLEDSREVILYFCKKYELDQSRTHLLLSELQSAQNQSFLTLTDFEIKMLSKEKYLQRRKKARNDDGILIASLVLKWIGPNGRDDQDLIKFLLLSKTCLMVFKRSVLKNALLFEQNVARLNRKRNTIWVKLLNIDSDNKDYYAFRDKVNSKDASERTFEDDGLVYKAQTLKNSVAELIAMDVQRSFHSYRHIVKPEILQNILKTYAFFNPEIEYC